MAINILDHDAAYLHLGDALGAVTKARLILRDTSASVEVRDTVAEAQGKIYEARTIINGTIMKQMKESTA